ncbi:unnamed protein product [Camellia sinensis]
MIVNLLAIATLLSGLIIQVECLNFNFPNFPSEDDLIMTTNASIFDGAIQVTKEARGISITDLSGRVWYKKQFKLWSRKKNITASFNSTFVLNISPQSGPVGEGLAFILTTESGRGSIPQNSQGKWLGIANATTNGSTTKDIVAVEFDTKKSYPDDFDDNHVGIDVNSINSIKQVSLNDHNVNISSAQDVTVNIQYNGTSLFVFMTNETVGSQYNPILSMPLNLSEFLPEDVFVGFSASTGENTTQLNCVKSWQFDSTEIDDAADRLWVWIVIAVILVSLICGFSLLCYLRMKYRGQQVRDDDRRDVEQQIQSSATAPKKFRLKELKHATGNFNPKNELGRGGCGIVYKGLLDSKEVAVKRFSKDSSQGKQDFVAEITTIGNLHHKNIVKLIGWCYECNELLLIYEFMPNRSLEKLIFRNKSQDPEDSTLSWEMRHGIICGVTQALDYIHNGCAKRVLHRDIKASNIMLDSEFNACLGDFGLARTFQVGEITHHSTKEVAGTPGYMAPESFLTGRATVQTDVYAFGVLLLEVACGRKPGNQNDQNNYSNGIVGWVWELYKSERIIDAIDTRLSGDFDEEQAECVLKLALACCHPNPHQRPTTRTVLQALTGEAAPPPIPKEKPAFMWPPMDPSFTEDLNNCSLERGEITSITVQNAPWQQSGTTEADMGGWTDSSGTEVGSEYSEGRRNLRPHQVFHPPSQHQFRRGLSMELADSSWQLEQYELDRCLIGYVADVRRFGSYLMQMHVNELWNLEGAVHVYGRSKNHYVFLFEHLSDMHRIAENGPYALQGALLIVDYWKPDLILDRLIFDKMMVWVQLHGLPLECFTEEAGFSLGRAVGDVVKVDMDSLMPRNIRFLRIRVWVFLDKPLCSGFFLKLRDGHQHWVRCCYERVCKVCRNCGRIGHTITTCSLSFAEAQRFLDDHFQDMGRQLHSPVITQELHPMYSASIRANAHRSDRRTTRIFQTASSSHMEIPEEAGPSTINQTVTSNDDFAAMWEQDWDDGLRQDTPEGSEPMVSAPTNNGVLQPIPPAEFRSVDSDVLSGLGQIPVDSVGELEVMWNQWEGQLSSMGIRPGQLVLAEVGELTTSLPQLL